MVQSEPLRMYVHIIYILQIENVSYYDALPKYHFN